MYKSAVDRQNGAANHPPMSSREGSGDRVRRLVALLVAFLCCRSFAAWADDSSHADDVVLKLLAARHIGPAPRILARGAYVVAAAGPSASSDLYLIDPLREQLTRIELFGAEITEVRVAPFLGSQDLVEVLLVGGSPNQPHRLDRHLVYSTRKRDFSRLCEIYGAGTPAQHTAITVEWSLVSKEPFVFDVDRHEGDKVTRQRYSLASCGTPRSMPVLSRETERKVIAAVTHAGYKEPDLFAAVSADSYLVEAQSTRPAPPVADVFRGVSFGPARTLLLVTASAGVIVLGDAPTDGLGVRTREVQPLRAFLGHAEIQDLDVRTRFSRGTGDSLLSHHYLLRGGPAAPEVVFDFVGSSSNSNEDQSSETGAKVEKKSDDPLTFTLTPYSSANRRQAGIGLGTPPAQLCTIKDHQKAHCEPTR